MRKYFYDVWYFYENAVNSKVSFHIGHFSSSRKAQEAINAVKDQPGFKDSGGKFEVDKFAVSFDHEVPKKSGLILYEASHEYEDAEGYDNWIIFGVFATKTEAEEELSKQRLKSPYKDHPDGFCIAESHVDLLGWSEGFTSWDDE